MNTLKKWDTITVTEWTLPIEDKIYLRNKWVRINVIPNENITPQEKYDRLYIAWLQDTNLIKALSYIKEISINNNIIYYKWDIIFQNWIPNINDSYQELMNKIKK
jgi:hypothetical protein